MSPVLWHFSHQIGCIKSFSREWKPDELLCELRFSPDQRRGWTLRLTLGIRLIRWLASAHLVLMPVRVCVLAPYTKHEYSCVCLYMYHQVMQIASFTSPFAHTQGSAFSLINSLEKIVFSSEEKKNHKTQVLWILIGRDNSYLFWTDAVIEQNVTCWLKQLDR